MKRLFALLFLYFAVINLYGQSTSVTNLFQSNFKKAETLYNHLAYRNALELYLAVVEKDSSNYVARQRAADCYFRLGKISDAEKWYASLANVPGIPPQYKYQYAQVLSMQGKYADAQKWFSEYMKVNPDSRAQSKFDFIYYLSYYYRDSVLYSVRNEPFSSDQSDFAPQYHKDGVVFVSARDRDSFVKRQSASALNNQEAMLNIFYAPVSASGEVDATLFYHRNLNSVYHDGPIAFFGKASRVVFSRNNLAGGKPVYHTGKVNLKLYFAELDAENKMKNEESFPYNNDSHSIGHPWISEDGTTLYFASNLPGGEGGVDLYKSEKKNDHWSAPQNLGPSVNTMGDEFYPYLYNDSTLYFSSTGHGGLGGLDIYMSKVKADFFSKPENLGFPINTPYDDFALVMDSKGRQGMFSSNREGGKGYDDIYSFQVKSFFVTGKVIERDDSSKSIAGAKILVCDVKGNFLDSAVSDPMGYFHMDLAFDNDYHFSAKRPGFSWIDTLQFSTYSRALGSDSLLVPLWKHALFTKGIVYSNESQMGLEGATVTLENLTDGKIDSTITSASGSYNFLVKPGKNYRIRAQKEGFISQEFELNTSGLKSGDLLNDLLLEEVFVEKVTIQFDFEQWNLKDDYHAALHDLANILQRNKKSHLHIGAYADARGTHDYNQSLSDKRAKEVVRYFESLGIEPGRVTAIGFGEALLLNHCSSGVKCPEEFHSKNRRAELKVQL